MEYSTEMTTPSTAVPDRNDTLNGLETYNTETTAQVPTAITTVVPAAAVMPATIVPVSSMEDSYEHVKRDVVADTYYAQTTTAPATSMAEATSLPDLYDTNNGADPYYADTTPIAIATATSVPSLYDTNLGPDTNYTAPTAPRLDNDDYAAANANNNGTDGSQARSHTIRTTQLTIAQGSIGEERNVRGSDCSRSCMVVSTFSFLVTLTVAMVVHHYYKYAGGGQ